MNTIAVVEDSDSDYGKICPILSGLGYQIERRVNRRDAYLLAEEIALQAFWIVDGYFPKFSDSHQIDRLGPSFVLELSDCYEVPLSQIVGLTADTEIFEGAEVQIFSKQYMQESLESIRRLIQLINI